MTSGYAITTLVVFIFSIFFVVHPVSIPTPRSLPRIPINLTTAPILAIALLWAAQCIDPAVIRNGIVGTEGVKPYNIVILFFTLAYMAITLDVTGILRAAVFWVSNKSGRSGRKLYLYFYVMLTLFSVLIGNDPVILSGTAFLVYYTRVASLDPRPWIMAEFAAANTASMVLFVRNPTNVVICEGFGVNNAAFTAYTVLPFLVCNIFCFVALAFQFQKQVPRKLERAPYRDARTALQDPVGALVGCSMLCATIVVCLVASFFGIDAWMISLPFAFVKFIFDLGWDYYRNSRGRPMVVDEDLDEESTSTGASQQVEDSNSHHSLPGPIDMEESQYTVNISQRAAPKAIDEPVPQSPPAPDMDPKMPYIFMRYRLYTNDIQTRLVKYFPTFVTVLPRLPFALVPFGFSQFILIEALNHQGWVNIFGNWFVRASHKEMHSTIWLVGVLGVILCNLSGTNIGATILLTQVIRAAELPYDVNRAAAIALAVASNIAAVSFTFSASLTGLLWRANLKQQGIYMKQREFAFWNLLPILVMTAVGLGVVSAEMAVLFQSGP